MIHANVKILHNSVKSSAPTFMPLGHVPQFYNDAPSNARDIHSIAMQEQPMDMQSSFKCGMSGITHLHNILSSGL